MANDLPLFDIVWEPPGSKLSLYDEKRHANGTVYPFGMSNRKALPLSLFGEADEAEEIEQPANENGDAVESKVEGENDDEFGDFESVPSQPVGTEKSSNGWASIPPIATETSSNGWVSTTPIETTSNGFVSTTPIGTESSSNSWVSTNGLVSTTPIGTEKSSSGWASTTPTSQLMLAMHGIHRYHHSPKADDFTFPQLSNGFASSTGNFLSTETMPASISHDQAPGAENGVDDSDSDIWGDFVKPSVSASSWSMDTSKFSSSLLDTPLVPVPVDKDHTKTAGPHIDMFDLISMSDDIPASTQVKEDRDLMSGPVLNDAEEGEKFLLLWDTNLDSQPVEVFGPADISANGSPGNFIKSGTAALNESPMDEDRNAALPLSLFEETGYTEASLGYNAPQTVSDLGSSYSRSVSLPGVAGVNFSDLISSLYEESDGVPDDGSKLHHRRHSSSTLSSSTLNERPFGEPIEAVAEVETANSEISTFTFGKVDVDEGIKSGMEDLLDSSLPNGRKSTVGDDLIDISGLDWELNEAGTALNGLDENGTSYLDTWPGTASKPEAESAHPQGSVVSPMVHSQLQYARAWSSLACACASELGNGLDIWQEATISGSCMQLVSTKQGENYFAAIAQIYKVYLILSATVQLYSSWLQAGEEQGKATMLLMDQCREAWTGLRSAVELLGTSIVEDLGRLEDALHSIVGSAVQVDAAQEIPESHCGLSLLPLHSVSGVPSVKWDEKSYFLPIANLWANRVSYDPPLSQSECLDV